MKKRRWLDVVVIILCLVGGDGSLWLFWRDLNRTLVKQSETPIAYLTEKTNATQRRFVDRLIWSQLRQDSPIYNGDFIRTADLSDALITFTTGDSVALTERTLIQVSLEQGGNALVEIAGGSITLDAQREARVLNGAREVRVTPGSVIALGGDEAGEMTMQVVQGSAQVFSTPDASAAASGEAREVSRGQAIRVDSAGAIQQEAAVVVRSPLPVQGYLSSSSAALRIPFTWTQAGFTGPVRLEIAQDRHFTRVIRSVEGEGGELSLEMNPGTWWWRMYPAGRPVPSNPAQGKLTIRYAVVPEPELPAEGDRLTLEGDDGTILFQWTAPADAGDTEVTYFLEVADNPAFSGPLIARETVGTSLLCSGFSTGRWYWRVSARYPGGFQGSVPVSPAASFVAVTPAAAAAPELYPEVFTLEPEPVAALPAEGEAAATSADAVPPLEPVLEDLAWVEGLSPEDGSAEAAEAETADEAGTTPEPERTPELVKAPEPVKEPEPVKTPEPAVQPKTTTPAPSATTPAATAPAAAAPAPAPRQAERVVLESPAQGAAIEGLEALRRPGVLRWSSTEQVGSSRIILSRNANPLQGTPILDQVNPPRSVALPVLEPGTYYWTVEAETPEGVDISSRRIASFRVLSIPLLPAPALVFPAPDARVSTEEILPGASSSAAATPTLTFTWGTVKGATGYLFELWREGAQAPLVHAGPFDRTSYTFENLGQLDNGGYRWQVEAVAAGAGGVLEQRGSVASQSFVFDVPQPDQPVITNPGLLYDW